MKKIKIIHISNFGNYRYLHLKLLSVQDLSTQKLNLEICHLGLRWMGTK